MGILVLKAVVMIALVSTAPAVAQRHSSTQTVDCRPSLVLAALETRAEPNAQTRPQRRDKTKPQRERPRRPCLHLAVV